jgi:hypothetical protein
MDFEKMGKKPSIALYTIPNPVHYAMIMIKSPTTSRIQVTVTPMIFFFTVNVV